ILLGNVLAAAFLLRAFQQIFIANPKRNHQPYSSSHHPVATERLIAAVLILLLMGTGFYTTPWLNLVDHSAAALTKHFPIHSSHPTDTADNEGEQHE
ncbi:MAG: NADH:quinone oxidoreductase, partial [Methylophilaceae bacterium]|nr:NADH:quinone oxidoreductase [Methylophilaceae bacterium]